MCTLGHPYYCTYKCLQFLVILLNQSDFFALVLTVGKVRLSYAFSGEGTVHTTDPLTHHKIKVAHNTIILLGRK